MSKPREFWLNLEEPTKPYEVTKYKEHALEYQRDYGGIVIHVREVVPGDLEERWREKYYDKVAELNKVESARMPIDWAHIWIKIDSMIWPQDNPNEMISRERQIIQKLVEDQLKGSE